MILITQNRIRKKIERAKRKAARILLNTPEEYLKTTGPNFIIKVKLGRYLYIDFQVENLEELHRIATGESKNEK